MREQWDGGEWQQHCCKLLGLKHGEDIQFVPDRVRGDGGLEAYRLDDTIVYQCYAPKDCFTVEAQTNAQKKKIRDDIRKLVDNPLDTVALLGSGYMVRRWVLLTPEYDDKELVKYAREKSEKVRENPRPKWCHATFEIVMHTDRTLFAVEMAALYREPAGTIRLQIQEPHHGDLSVHVEPNITDSLTKKLLVDPSFATDTEYLAGYRDETLFDYIYGKNYLEQLQDRYPLAYETVSRRANATYRKLYRRLAAGNGGASDIEALTQELADGFINDIPVLDRVACQQLAQHYVAAWWITCPLRFRASA
ncbi:hypothetical protein [Nonomuraea sp. NPDC048916]|uniref:hypothetical protein n=1 Tax=Nonomuraea sp. NPDC048916 TaxID=3154232 RepID=UPI0034010C00